jgi:4-amino-4-deoxy-L-arabinose transferase-like glycosyltransferase
LDYYSKMPTKIHRGRTALGIGAIVLLALIVRVWVWSGQGRAGMVYPGDQDEYYRGAIHILLRGDYYDEGQWLRPPLTSLLFAGVFAFSGVHIPAAMLFQCVLSAATVLLLAELARKIWASQHAAMVTALLAALFLPYASYASQMLSETLFIFTIAAALLIFEAARQRGMPWRWLFAGGMVWGLSALTRPVGLYAVPLLVAWAALEKYKNGERHPLPLARSATALLIGFIIIVAPWTARNYAIYHQLVVVDTNSGVSFWLGNLLEPNEGDLQSVWNRTLPDSAQRQQAALQRAWSNIAREPLTFLSRLRYKTVSLWQLNARLFVGNAPIGLTIDERSLSFALAADAEYIALMILALLGIVLAIPGERNLALLIWPIYGSLLSAVSLGHPRLRLPLLITALVYAALPLAHPRRIWERLRNASWWRRAGLVAGLVAFALLIYSSAYGRFVHSQFWLLVARFGGGTTAIEQAIAVAPDNYLPYLAMAEAQLQHDDIIGALASYDRAATLAPQNTTINLQRLSLRRRLGDPAGAQAAMHAIAAVGWDNNQTYDWAWQHIPAAVGERIDIAAPAPGVMRGVSAVEYDQDVSSARPYRWIMRHAQIRLSLPGADRLAVVLRADQPNTLVSIFYQQQHVATLRIGTNWEHFDIALPAMTPPHDLARPTGADFALLEIDAPTHVISTDQPYPRGVAIAEAWLARSAAMR